jgi:hypothetical protein
VNANILESAAGNDLDLLGEHYAQYMYYWYGSCRRRAGGPSVEAVRSRRQRKGVAFERLRPRAAPTRSGLVKSDIRSQSTGLVYAWLCPGVATFQAGYVTTQPAGWQIVR